MQPTLEPRLACASKFFDFSLHAVQRLHTSPLSSTQIVYGTNATSRIQCCGGKQFLIQLDYTALSRKYPGGGPMAHAYQQMSLQRRLPTVPCNRKFHAVLELSGCEFSDKIATLLKQHDLQAEGSRCSFPVDVNGVCLEYEFYATLLEMLDDWLCPKKIVLHLCDVAIWENRSEIVEIMADEKLTESSIRKDCGEVKKAVLLHIISRRLTSPHVKDLFSSLAPSKKLKLLECLAGNLAKILHSMLYEMMLEAIGVGGRSDVLKCLIHILANTIAVYGCVTEVLSATIAVLPDKGDEIVRIFRANEMATHANRPIAETLLLHAVRCGNFELARVLLERPSDASLLIDAKSIADVATGDTLLHSAARLGEPDLGWLLGDAVNQVRMYLLLRTKPAILEEYYSKALAVCYLSFVSLPAYFHALPLDTFFHHPHLFRVHLSRNVRAEDFLPLIDFLIELGCDVNARNVNNDTPLHVTAATNVTASAVMLTLFDVIAKSGQSVELAAPLGDIFDETHSANVALQLGANTHVINERTLFKIFVRALLRWEPTDDDVSNSSDSSDVGDSKQTLANPAESVVCSFMENGASISCKNLEDKVPAQVALQEMRFWIKVLNWQFVDEDRIGIASRCATSMNIELTQMGSGSDYSFGEEITADRFAADQSALLTDIASEKNLLEKTLLLTNVFAKLFPGDFLATSSAEVSSWIVELPPDQKACAFSLLLEAGKQDIAACLLRIWSEETPNTWWPEFTVTALSLSEQTATFLSVEIPLNATDSEGQTALHIAAKRNELTSLQILFRHGADINAADNEGYTALAAALKAQSADKAAIVLLSEHCKSNCSDSDQTKRFLVNHQLTEIACNAIGQTILHVAAERDDASTVRNILQCGADITVLDYHGRSPLATALNERSWEAARILLDSCSNAVGLSRLDVAVGNFGATLFHSLDANDLPDDIADKLFRNDTGVADFTLLAVSNFYGDIPFHNDLKWAAKTGQYCYANMQNLVGKTPLHLTIERDQLDPVEDVLKHGGDITIQDAMFNTPLHGSKVTVDAINRLSGILYQLNVEVDDRPNIFGERNTLCWIRQPVTKKPGNEFVDYLGNTKLHVAAGVYGYCGLEDNTKFFIEAASDERYSSRNAFGRTPIHIRWLACGFNTLLSKDVFRNVVNVKDSRGRTIWHHVFLFEAFRHLTDYVHDITYLDQYDENKKLKSKRRHSTKRIDGCDSTDDLGRNPLHYAAMKSESCSTCRYSGCLLYCKCCLDFFGFDCIRVKDKYGRTPWHYAYMNGFRLADDDRHLFPEDVIDEDSADCFGYSPKQLFDSRLDDKTKESKNEFIQKLMDDIGNKCSGQFTLDRRGDAYKVAIGGLWSQYSGAINTWKLWLDDLHSGMYSEQRISLSAAVYDATTNFISKIVDAVGKEDPRLRGRLLHVGSSFEKTRVDTVYEFDFNVVLELSELCEVLPTCEDDTVPGFVVLKRKNSINFAKFRLYEDFFDADGRLNVKKVNFSFQSAIIKVLSWQQFWEDEHVFDISYYEFFHDVVPNKRTKHLSVRFNKLVDDKYIAEGVSIDIVPVIHIPGWWPTDGCAMDDEVRSEGCNFVLDQPYSKYRVPYSSTQYVKLSFARAESLVMRRSPAVVRAAYMVSKLIWMHCGQSPIISHVLKMATLWSMKNKAPAVADDQTVVESELQEQVEQLFAQLYQFSVQDYVPCFFMPSFHFPVWKSEEFINDNHAFLRSVYMSYEKLFQIKTVYTMHHMDYEYIKRSCVYSYVLYAAVSGANSYVDWIWPQLTTDVSARRSVTYIGLSKVGL